MEELKTEHIRFMNPFMAFTDEATLEKRLVEVFREEYQIPKEEVQVAAQAAWKELIESRDDMRRKGEEVLEWMAKTGRRGIVLAGRPYHVDPEINHGIPELITCLLYTSRCV